MFAACESPAELDTVIENSDQEISIDEETIKEMWYSPEWQRIVDQRRESLEFISQAIERGITKQELKYALKTDLNSQGVSSNFDDLVFPDSDTTERFRNSISESRKAFVDKYPQILTIEPDGNAECDLTENQTYRVIDNIDAILEQHDRRYALNKTTGTNCPECGDNPPEIVCGSWWNIARLIACNGLASFCGGPTVVLCAWGCWCEFCDQSTVGGWICG